MAGWFGSRARTEDGKRVPHTTMTASGRRLDLTDRRLVSTISATRLAWQADAWSYRGNVGELSAALRFRANALAKVGLKIGQVVEGEDEPLDADAKEATLPDALRKAAQECLDALPWRNGYAFLGVLDTCFSVTGEAWLHGRPATPEDMTVASEVWSVLSTSEVQPVGSGGRLGIVSVPGKPARPVDPKTEALIRLWVPDPEFKALADSPVKAIRDVLEDIVLGGRELRAAARSRISANGILFITNEMSIVHKGTDEADEPEDFTSGLEAAMLAPIANEGESGAVVPIVVQGDKEDIDAAKHMTLERATAADLNDRIQASLTRMAESIDVPPTVVTGLADTNHWNAYVIDSTTWSNHLEPGCRIGVDSLTEGYLRTRLCMPTAQDGYGFTPAEAAQVTIWYDAGKVTENANRGQDAKDAYDRFAIGGAALRESLGFNDDDKPDDDELMIMLASKVSVDPATAGALVQKVLGNRIDVPQPTVVNAPPDRQLPPGQDQPPPNGQPAHPEAPPNTRNTPPGVRTGSANKDISYAPGLHIVTGDKLAAIDTHLLERLLVAADAAVARALEKANARIRSASVNRLDRAELAAHAENLASWLGPERVSELGLTEDALLAAAFELLAVKFTDWSTSAIRASVKATASMLGLPLEAVAELTRTLTARIPAAWSRLHEALRKRAMAHLFGKAGTELRGESPEDVVKAGDIRTALATIGGAHVDEGGASDDPLGGIALGPTITERISQAVGPVIGRVWVYGPEIRNNFRPHQALDDHRFDGPTDARLSPPAGYEWLGPRMHPGDHEGCRCGWVPAWIFPTNYAHTPPEVRTALAAVTSLATEPVSMRAVRALAESDDAAGRHDTVAQQQRDVADRVARMRTDWLASGNAA